VSKQPGDVIADELDALDARIAARGVTIWVGAEPTFTRRDSTEPCWLWQAEGGDKRAYAESAARAIGARIPGATVAEVPGRHYPEEDAPRFCVAVKGPLGTLTVTPDPGVVEVNTAPCPDLATFLRHVRVVYAGAADAGLAPVRYRYNGDQVDSGGGGQITLGGSSPEASPWFKHPALLPRLVRYVNNHPALSYWFLGEHAGSACQAPRADEGVRERWDELRLATRVLERAPATPDLLHATFGPLLVDAAGNSHRAELNVEKLWNPQLPDRGLLGLVEWRAFKMAPTPEQLAAAAALIRAVAARCAVVVYDEPMIDWGSALHDRMALPVFLRDDLAAVFADLEAHGLGLGAALETCATSYRDPVVWTGEPFPGVVVTLSRALEFWPLIGDVASQERAASRLVDSSSERFELRLDVPHGRGQPIIVVGGHTIMLRTANAVRRTPAEPGFAGLPQCARAEAEHTIWVVALRRRVFVPSPGLHPSVPAFDPLVIQLRDRAEEIALRLYGWRPGSGAYDGLPADADEAAKRRAERVVLTTGPVATRPPHPCLHPDTWTVDLRHAELVTEEP